MLNVLYVTVDNKEDPKNTSYKETYLSLDRFKIWFDDEFVAQLFSMQMCGNW